MSAKELTPPNEQSRESDFAGKNSKTAVMSLQNCQISTCNKIYQKYCLWCVIGIFWFFPFGMIATVYASQAVASMNSGNYEKAVAKERNAKRWLIATAIAGAFFVVVGIYSDVYGN
ncbi:CD225/dispanin family protein [Desulfovibrio sp. DV]|uniref:CD225/dispanin family protein n=1 Tax=Desulfovibrio sp. DV TaxID=1844708 RepID=UPI0011152EF0|nr:CD225/dispanin family protein [Desulfovibrio sp. DV]